MSSAKRWTACVGTLDGGDRYWPSSLRHHEGFEQRAHGAGWAASLASRLGRGLPHVSRSRPRARTPLARRGRVTLASRDRVMAGLRGCPLMTARRSPLTGSAVVVIRAANVAYSSTVSTGIEPTEPDREQALGRVALWLDPGDLRWLAAHCCCAADAAQETKDQCLRLRFRASAALHKAGLER